MKKGGGKNAGNHLKDCHFSKEEQESLVKMFKDLTKKSLRGEKMERGQFREVLHCVFKMTDDVIMDRVLRAFDKDSDACINLHEWMSGLSIFLKGSLEEKIQFCFKVYDLNSDGFISREEMFHLLKTSMVKNPSEEDPEEGIKDIVEILVKKMDHDHDGKLSFKDYEQSVKMEPLLLECFGTCLPEQKTCDIFMGECKRRMLEDILFPQPELPYPNKGRHTKGDYSSDEGSDDEDDILRMRRVLDELLGPRPRYCIPLIWSAKTGKAQHIKASAASA